MRYNLESGFLRKRGHSKTSREMNPRGRYSMLKRLCTSKSNSWASIWRYSKAASSWNRRLAPSGRAGGGGPNDKLLQGEYKKGHEDEESWTRTTHRKHNSNAFSPLLTKIRRRSTGWKLWTPMRTSPRQPSAR